jgi:NADH:ubiquinone oxidoreductase subunit 6 (subunit J)
MLPEKVINCCSDFIKSVIGSGIIWYFLFLFLILLIILALTLYSNPVYILISFISLIGFIFILLRLYGAEFISIVIIIIYVGVFAVLFLFTLIIYPHSQREEVYLKKVFTGFKKEKSIWVYFGFFPIFVLILNFAGFIGTHYSSLTVSISGVDIQYFEVLYNDYWPVLIMLAFLLFLVIIGVIAITRYVTYLSR